MVVEAAVLGGDWLGWWWGVMRGGAAPAITGAERAPGGSARAREAVATVVGPGRKTTGQGP
jgi:hypothetical protein